METIFNNLINGNLKDAKRLAKPHSTFRLSMYARQILGWSLKRSYAAAYYLKDEAPFQLYCDTK
jgi:hypothetical protein